MRKKTDDSNTGQDLTRIEALTYELRVSAVMEREVLTVSAEEQVERALDLLQQQQVSGIPVVCGGKLAGTVGFQDLIPAVQRQDLDAPVRKYMSTNKVAVRPDDLVIEAVKLFSQTRADHLAVVEDDGNLVGIVTKGDVTGGLIEALESSHKEEDIRRYRASHLFEDIVSDRTSLILRYRIKHREFVNSGMASARVRQALLRLGAPLEIARRCAIAIYEAEMNLVIHTINGGILRVEIQPHMIFIEALDDGPGIEDIQLAMQPGYTTTPDEIRALGFGAGFGLTNIERCVDKMWLKSTPGEGTRLEMWIYLEPGAEHRTLETILDRLS